MTKKLTKFDFEDRRGPVPAHQHINPDGTIGGWVADSVEFSAEAKVFIAGKVRFSGYFHTYIRGGDFRGGDFWGGVIKTNRDFIVFASCGSRDAPLTVQFEDETLYFTSYLVLLQEQGGVLEVCDDDEEISGFREVSGMKSTS